MTLALIVVEQQISLASKIHKTSHLQYKYQVRTINITSECRFQSVRKVVYRFVHVFIYLIYCFLAESSTSGVSLLTKNQNITKLLGSIAVLECAAEGAPVPSITWTRQGKNK